MSKAVSAKTNVPASEIPESAVLSTEPPPGAVPETSTELANGSSNKPDGVIKPFVVIIVSLPPNA